MQDEQAVSCGRITVSACSHRADTLAWLASLRRIFFALYEHFTRLLLSFIRLSKREKLTADMARDSTEFLPLCDASAALAGTKLPLLSQKERQKVWFRQVSGNLQSTFCGPIRISQRRPDELRTMIVQCNLRFRHVKFSLFVSVLNFPPCRSEEGSTSCQDGRSSPQVILEAAEQEIQGQ